MTTGLHLFTKSQWSFYQDDLLFTAEVPTTGLLDFMFRPIASHWAPGTLGLIWVVTTLDPMSYAWATATTTVLAAGTVLVWGLLLREIFGERLHLLAGVVLLAVTPGLLMDSLWWSRGLGVYTTLLIMGLCLWFLAKMLVRGPSVLDAVGLAGSYAFGLFMWEKSLVVTIPLLFLCLLLGPSDLRGAVRRCVRLLWPVTVLTIVYIPLFLYAVRDAPEVHPDEPVQRSVGAAFSFLAHGIVDLALPTMVGGPFTEPTGVSGYFPDASGSLALGLFSATVLLVILALRFRRRGWLAIAMVVTHALIAWGLVFFTNRFEFVGDLAIRSPHYSADLVPVMVLAALFLVTRTVLDEEVPVRTPVRPETLSWLRRGLTGYLALVCVVVPVTTGRVWDHLKPESPKPYFDTLFAEARDLGTVDVYDSRVPKEIVNPALLDAGSKISAVLRPLDLPLRYNQPAEQYAMVDESGHFRTAAVVGGHTNAGPGPDGECGYAVNAGEVTRIPLTGDLFALEWAMEITYFTGSDARIAVRTDDDRVELDLPTNEAGDVGRRQLVIASEVTSLEIEGLSGENTVCVAAVRIGIIEPTDEVPDQLKDDED